MVAHNEQNVASLNRMRCICVHAGVQNLCITFAPDVFDTYMQLQHVCHPAVMAARRYLPTLYDTIDGEALEQCRRCQRRSPLMYLSGSLLGRQLTCLPKKATYHSVFPSKADLQLWPNKVLAVGGVELHPPCLHAVIRLPLVTVFPQIKSSRLSAAISANRCDD